MAQIIKHRRGALETVGSATKRAGELLVITGSSGITATNGDSLLFVGIDGSTATPANKILQGTSVPDLTGASYDTSVDGIPFYDTDDQKLYILNKGGNVEVKASAQTGGTGIFSGSSQVVLNDADKTGFNTADVSEDSSNLYFTNARVKARLDAETVISGSGQLTSAFDTRYLNTGGDSVVSASAQIISLVGVDEDNFSSDSATKFPTQQSVKAYIATQIATKDNSDEITEGSTNLYFTNARAEAVSINNVVEDTTPQLGGNLDAQSFNITTTGKVLYSNVYSAESDLPNAGTYHGMFAHVHGTGKGYFAHGGSWIKLIDESSSSTTNLTEGTNLYFTNARVKTRLDAETVVSGSSQIVSLLSNQATDFGTGRVSGDNFGDADGGSTFTGSFVGNGSGLTGLATNLNISGSTGNDTVDLINNALTFAGTANEITTAVTDNTVTISLPDDVTIGNDLTVVGNLDVQGTTTTVDSTTVQIGDNIIELNGTGATNGGIHVKDATAPNTDTGSLIWDSANDLWAAGVKGSEIALVNISGTQTLTNKTINGSNNTISNIANSSLTNDGITIAGVDTSLGGSISADAIANAVSGNVISGSSQVNANTITNFDSNVDARMDAKTVISGSGQVSLGSVTGNTDNITEGSSNLFHTNERVDDRVNTLLTEGTGISLTYDDSAGTLTIAGSAQYGDSDVTDHINSLSVVSGSATQVRTLLNVENGATADQTGAEIKTALFSESDTNNLTNTLKSKLDGIEASANVTDAGNVTPILNTLGVISGSSQLEGANIENFTASGSFSGSFVGDGSGLSGIATTLGIAGDSGTDTVSLSTGTLTFGGGTGISAAVTDDTVTYNIQDASTSVKGIASFSSTNFGDSSGNITIKNGGVPASALAADVAGTGISLNGVDNAVEVDYGSTAGTAVEGNTGLTVQGTNNEIEVSGGSVTLGSGGTVTVGLPDEVTIATASIQQNLSVGGNATITGNLSVLGTTTTVDSTTVQIGDNVLELNYGGAQTDAGLLVTDAQAPNTISGSLLWDGTNDYWKGGAAGSEKELARLNASPTSNTVLKANSSGLLVDSLITDDGTNVTISGTAELRINAGTANSFVYFDTNKSLEAVTPSNAGDVIQWNGSSFVASREIDGGTF
jgi:hypothetical protein